MFRSIFFLIALGISLSLRAQTAVAVEGVVFDVQTKEPLPGVTVLANGTQIGTTTDATGAFRLSCPANCTALTIRSVGYTDQTVRPGAGKLLVQLQQRVQDLQGVVVTGSREAALRTQTPIAIARLSARTVEETKPTALYEVINKAPGALMVNLGNEQHSMAIRQPMTTNAYFLYLEDGVPIRPMGVFNHNALLELNQFTVSSLEIVKGPVSSVYGPEAVGGAVNVLTQRPTAVPTVRAGVQVDQFGYRRVQVGAGARQGKFGLYVGGLVSRQRDGWMAVSDYDKASYYGRAEYQFTAKTRLTGTFWYNDYYSQTSGSVDSVAFFARQYISTTGFTYRQTFSVRSRLTLEHDWQGGAQSFVTAFYRNNRNGQNPAYAIRWTPGQTTARGEINSNDFQSLGLIAQHTQPLGWLSGKLITGATVDESPNQYWAYQIDLNAQLRPDKRSVERYSMARERPDLPLANYEARIHNLAAYTQLELEPLPNLRLSAGVRYDRMAFYYTNGLDRSAGRKQFSQFTPKLGATYDLGRGKGLYVNYAQGFAPPALTSIFRKRTTPAPNGDLFYYNLGSARFDNMELGGWAAFWAGKVYIDYALYQMRGRNELLNVRMPDNSTDYQSAGKTLHRGVELSVTLKPSKNWLFRFGGTSALHRFEQFALSERAGDAVRNVDGREMPSAPRTVWNTELSYYPQFLPNFRASVEWQHVSGWYQNQVNTVRYPGYDLLNGRVGYAFRGVEVFTNVLNLTNALYATNASRGNNPTDRTTFTPAAPRTFVVGIQYNFTAKTK
ncbi:TonB-dependent receptor [Rudanella paleaurantiibacter]|uniref:TonB-dependent receptor n=1 Tax=Rudanella paleaurantiibacter TaxID=2614655 RepID=A0A7J5TU96_9BACT|nr:TonB-dependent receptor [Rudanella paleaurantiibacter]KAB7727373.1 TonB-dependent receptor [Rudanella paleaurantiibacter]